MTNQDLEKILIGPNMAIQDALAALNDAHRRIVIVVDDSHHILGVITDSNFRHAMLNKQDFSEPISTIMTRLPITATPDMTTKQILNLMERTHCHEVPVVSADGRVTDLLLIEDILRQRTGEKARRSAVIMAGGRGERLRPITEETPKPLVSVGGRPILFSIIDHLLAADFDRIYISVNYMADAIIDAVQAVSGYTPAIEFIQENEQMGTAGPLTLLPKIPQKPLLVLNADLLTKIDFSGMMRFHQHEGNAITIALREEKIRVPYGVAQLEGTRVVAMKEKPEYSHFVNTGVYVMDPPTISLLDEGVSSDMPELIERALAAGKRVGCFPVHEYWLDIGGPTELARANQDFANHFAIDQGDGAPVEEPE